LANNNKTGLARKSPPHGRRKRWEQSLVSKVRPASARHSGRLSAWLETPFHLRSSIRGGCVGAVVTVRGDCPIWMSLARFRRRLGSHQQRRADCSKVLHRHALLSASFSPSRAPDVNRVFAREGHPVRPASIIPSIGRPLLAIVYIPSLPQRRAHPNVVLVSTARTWATNKPFHSILASELSPHLTPHLSVHLPTCCVQPPLRLL
jgi:hypothetical protein